MAGLITLKLQPIPRPDKQPAFLPPPQAPPPIPPRSQRRPEMTMLPVLRLPQTQQQWRAALDEVRHSYLMKQYRQCSARCIQLLEGAPDMVFALHCVYLSFYAAICLELLARALPDASPQKLSTFDSARSYYEKAAHFMWDIECGYIFANAKLGLKSSVRLPQHSHDSSLDSSEISERSSATSSPTPYTFSPSLHSPASSVCSSISKAEDEPFNLLKPQPLRVKKSVTFHLGYGDHTQVRFNDTSNGGVTSNSSSPEIRNRLDTEFARFNIHLSTLRNRLTQHLSSIMQLTNTLKDSTQTMQLNSASLPPFITPTEQQPNQSATITTYIEDSKTDEQDTAQSLPQKQLFLQKQQQQRAEARAARIAALKQRGEDWKCGKGRFDAKRYEQLCGEALRDLADGRAGNFC